MSLSPPGPFAAGGMLEMEYADPLAGERHTWHIHVCHFDPVSFAYIAGGPKVPVEAGLSDTFSALGALWAAYYPASWTLQLLDVFYNSGGELTRLHAAPPTTPIVGASGLPSYFGPSVRRVFYLSSTRSAGYRVWIQQIPGDVMGVKLPVSPSAGGSDARDQALIAYLSSDTAGVVASDGCAFSPMGTVHLEWARPLEADFADSAVDSSGHLLTSCLAYPQGAGICNPSPDHLNVSSPGFDWRISNTGLTLSFGSHLAWTFTPTQLIDAAGTILETVAL